MTDIDVIAETLAAELGDRAVNHHPRSPDDSLWREAVAQAYIAEALTELTVTVQPHKPLVFAFTDRRLARNWKGAQVIRR